MSMDFSQSQYSTDGCVKNERIEIAVFVTASNDEEASKIASYVIEEGLAACANLVPSIKSFFMWEGRMTEAIETMIIFKTSLHLFDSLAAAVKQSHSYQVPEVIALPILRGTDEYLDFVRANIRK